METVSIDESYQSDHQPKYDSKFKEEEEVVTKEKEKEIVDQQSPQLFQSQAHQDRFVCEIIAHCPESFPKETKDRFYLDIGSGDPIYGSNTHVLEKNGWKGIQVDLDQKFITEHKQYRTNPFYVENVMTCDWSKKSLPKIIDYLSFDVDEATVGALENFPFDSHKFKIITIEHDQYRFGTGVAEFIRAKLLQLKYVIVCKNVKLNGNAFEDWWVHSELVPPEKLCYLMCDSREVTHMKFIHFPIVVKHVRETQIGADAGYNFALRRARAKGTDLLVNQDNENYYALVRYKDTDQSRVGQGKKAYPIEHNHYTLKTMDSTYKTKRTFDVIECNQVRTETVDIYSPFSPAVVLATSRQTFPDRKKYPAYCSGIEDARWISDTELIAVTLDTNPTGEPEMSYIQLAYPPGEKKNMNNDIIIIHKIQRLIIKGLEPQLWQKNWLFLKRWGNEAHFLQWFHPWRVVRVNVETGQGEILIEHPTPIPFTKTKIYLNAVHGGACVYLKKRNQFLASVRTYENLQYYASRWLLIDADYQLVGMSNLHRYKIGARYEMLMSLLIDDNEISLQGALSVDDRLMSIVEYKLQHIIDSICLF